MSGKVVGILILLAALAGGVGVWLAQTGNFAPIEAEAVTFTSYEGVEEAVPVTAFEGIAGDSSPLRYRACFAPAMTRATLTETFQPYPDPEPTIAPGWFDCFDADAIGAALESGAALAFLGTRNVVYGFDRVIAVDADGNGFAWHQINACGTAAFAGESVPAGCPPPPRLTGS